MKKWTKQEYLDLVERGAFNQQRIYLFRGDIIEMAPHGHPHAYGIMVLSRYLMDTFPKPYMVRIQCSFITPGRSVPEPDAAVCTAEDAMRRPHPSHAELIVEVAESSLKLDRRKAAEYAAARVPEYWIINTGGRTIEVYRRPIEDTQAPHGYRYAEMHVLNVGDQIAPENWPDAATPVAMFFA